MTKKYNLFCH